MRFLKQPLVIGYIISGIILGPFFLNLFPNKDTLEIFSQLGVTFLLFIVGIHLNPKTIKEFGKISLITGIGQFLFTSIIGYFIGILLGFSPLTSLYIAIALTFSSTIIITKLLSDKDSLDKLYGKISLGFLLVQDMIAILIIIIISSFFTQGNITNIIFINLIKILVIILILSFISYIVFPNLNIFFTKSQELLFVFAISWGIAVAALFSYLGLSIETGALIAGIMLSMSDYSAEITSKLKPLRDFFLIYFFIFLGTQIILGDVSNSLFQILIFSFFVLIGNPLIVMILMGILGYTKNTGFMTALTTAQISEFSFILVLLGIKLGHLNSNVLSFVSLIGIITITASSYMIIYSEKIYSNLSNYLSIFERKKIKENKNKEINYDYLLLGENRIGFSIMKYFLKSKKKYLIVDFNPERVRKLKYQGIKCILGDASDPDFLEDLKIEKSKILVSTIPDKETNLMILGILKEKNSDTISITTARNISDAFDLYKAGSNYVILPHFLGGEYVAKLIENIKENKKEYEIEKQKHIKELKERLKEGHEHPKTQK